jgi:hypothetical protein
MKPKDLTTIILSTAKIAKTAREAKLRRKMNNDHRVFSQLLLNKQSNPLEDVFVFCASQLTEPCHIQMQGHYQTLRMLTLW